MNRMNANNIARSYKEEFIKENLDKYTKLLSDNEVNELFFRMEATITIRSQGQPVDRG